MSGAQPVPGQPEAEAAQGANQPAAPVFQVVGSATDEEVAALTVVLAALSGGDATPAPRHLAEWGRPRYAVRSAHEPSRHGWRRMGLPR